MKDTICAQKTWLLASFAAGGSHVGTSSDVKKPICDRPIPSDGSYACPYKQRLKNTYILLSDLNKKVEETMVVHKSSLKQGEMRWR